MTAYLLVLILALGIPFLLVCLWNFSRELTPRTSNVAPPSGERGSSSAVLTACAPMPYRWRAASGRENVRLKTVSKSPFFRIFTTTVLLASKSKPTRYIDPSPENRRETRW